MNKLKRVEIKVFVQEIPHRCRNSFACKAPEFHSPWYMEYQLYFIVFAFSFTPKATNQEMRGCQLQKGEENE